MPGITRAKKDSAGGLIVGGKNSRVLAEGFPVVVLGDAVAGHGMAPHSAAVMVSASSRVFAGGIPVCRAGDLASCGHQATGSSRVSAS
jgi:uncharacterized Zn-binding protein involved in type VI secretion